MASRLPPQGLAIGC